ncbi:hypothetical protein [Singulisphaera sp. PoT]
MDLKLTWIGTALCLTTEDADKLVKSMSKKVIPRRQMKAVAAAS